MAKRVFQAIVLFFAIYAFVFVPLGEKTALEHVRAIAGTPAARQAASEVKGGVERLVERLRDDARQKTESASRRLEGAEDEDGEASELGRADARRDAKRPPHAGADRGRSERAARAPLSAPAPHNGGEATGE